MSNHGFKLRAKLPSRRYQLRAPNDVLFRIVIISSV